MSKNSDPSVVLFSKGNHNKKNTSAKNKNNEKQSSAEKATNGSSQNNNLIKCYKYDDIKLLDNVKNIVTDVVLTGEKKYSLFVMVVEGAYVKKTNQIVQQFGMLDWIT
ncbi:hypothetical protein REPUB_Repub06bG0082100 [Reevesia pubescens]